MPNEKYTKISFYIVAHADDWQLFMQPNAFNDLTTPGSKVVFITTTAGDAGMSKTYWKAREEGTKSSIRFSLAPLTALSEVKGKSRFNSHIIHYHSINNATCYFLRLPDGNLNNNGFSANDFCSLEKFRAGQISTITAIDDSATYNNWSDFYTTLEKIILSESNGISNIWINYLNPDIKANPNDHPDHIATGQAIQSMTTIAGLKQALFVGYNTGNVSENLDGTDLLWKAGMFAAYERAVFDGSSYSTLNESVQTYLRWCLSKAVFITNNL